MKPHLLYDEYAATATDAAYGTFRRVFPSLGAPYSCQVPVDGSWQVPWKVLAVQVELADSATTNAQGRLVKIEVLGSPRASQDMIIVHGEICGAGKRLTWVPPFPFPCWGIGLSIWTAGLLDGELVRTKVLYE